MVTGEDLGQYSQLKERMMERVGYDKDDLTYSYFDMAEVDYQDAEMDLESLPFFADQRWLFLIICLTSRRLKILFG